MPSPSKDQIGQFQQTVVAYYRAHGRHDLPWRQFEGDGEIDPYKVLVSELMLQQTQVSRVTPKFIEFIHHFPSVADVAQAPLAEVLQMWNGLGYNRRAKFLWQAANVIEDQHKGRVPDTLDTLVALPGIGVNTAGALLVYAYNKPAVFVETNIRTVMIYHFFRDEAPVADRAITDMVALTLPDNPREWYWALMDYGTFLKQTVGNLGKYSKSYTRQSAFEGSRRQVRGRVLRLLARGPLSGEELRHGVTDGRLPDVLEALMAEGMISKESEKYVLGASMV